MAITLHQPWASLMAWGLKTIETRSWERDYRGPLVIHAAASIPRYAREAAEGVAAIHEALEAREIESLGDLPLGVGLCLVQLEKVLPVAIAEVPIAERDFGNYERGRYAWVTRYLEAIYPPEPAVGRQGLWRWGEAPPARPKKRPGVSRQGELF